MRLSFLSAPRLPHVRTVDASVEQRRRVFMCVSVLLDYPGADFWRRCEVVASELVDLPQDLAQPLSDFLTWARSLGEVGVAGNVQDDSGVRALAEHFVQTFDQRRRCALWLSYYAVGDTRQRGRAIIAFAEAMRSAGWELSCSRRGGSLSELPDYLPVVLEFAGRDEGEVAWNLLAAHRDGLEVLRSALLTYESGYAHLLTAVCAALPDMDLQTLERFHQLVRQGPAAELVGAGAAPMPFSTVNPVPAGREFG